MIDRCAICVLWSFRCARSRWSRSVITMATRRCLMLCLSSPNPGYQSDVIMWLVDCRICSLELWNAFVCLLAAVLCISIFASLFCIPICITCFNLRLDEFPDCSAARPGAHAGKNIRFSQQTDCTKRVRCRRGYTASPLILNCYVVWCMYYVYVSA